MNTSTHDQGTLSPSPIAVPIVTPAAVTPTTELGRRLREIRARIVASGEPLLNWEDLDAELRERRGESPAGE
jgi:hypothetical protein